jgi:hypothetical protein
MKVSLRIKRLFKEAAQSEGMLTAAPTRKDDMVLDAIEMETAVRLNTALEGHPNPDLDTMILVAGAGRPPGGWLVRGLASCRSWFSPAPPPDAVGCVK